MLPSPCQGAGATMVPKLLEAQTNVTMNQAYNSGSLTVGKPQRSQVFNWRPDIENVLLDALELSMDDLLERHTKPTSFTCPAIKRGIIKSQIKQTLKDSRQEFEQFLDGQAVKRPRHDIDSAQFSASPITSFFLHSAASHTKRMDNRQAPRNRASAPLHIGVIPFGCA